MISTYTVTRMSYSVPHMDDAYFGELVELLHVAARVIFGRGQLGRKKSVDERRLSQSTLTLRKQVRLVKKMLYPTHQRP